MTRLKAWSDRLVPAGILLLGLALKIADPPALEGPRLNLFDTFQRLKPRPAAAAPVAIVDLDDETLNRLGQWPWPRTQVAALITRLSGMGAKAIALDIVFAEPDRTSPGRILEIWPATPELEPLRGAASSLPDHDAALAQAMAEAPVAAGFALVHEPTGRVPALKAGMAHAGEDPRRFVAGFSGAVVNLAPIEEAAKGNGHFNLLAERDGVVRRVPLFLRHGEILLPSLAAEAVRLSEGAGSYAIRSSGTGIEEVKVGRHRVPTDAQGRIWLHDSGPAPGRVIPAWEVMEEGFDPARVEGKILFVGTTAAGLKDFRATPLNPVTAGVEIHAQLAEQILAGDFLNRPDWAPGAEFLLLALVGLALILLLPGIGPFWCALLAAGAIAAAFAASWAAYARFHYLLDPVYPALVTLGIYLSGSLSHFLKTEGERRRVRQAFSRYMSPELVKRLAEHPGELKLGGETRNMTLLFADIRGFTTLSERFDAQGLTQFINRFLTPMTDLILQRRGTIDKYMGDCIMAFWNAPLDDPDHARHACEAALAMRDHLAGWNQQDTPVQIGIGINTGDCCVGNMGSEQRFDYSVLGDEVNLASRLEGQSKSYGVDILIGQGTREQALEFAALELDLITVKGKTKPVRIYGLLGDAVLRETSRFQQLQTRHTALLAAYRAQRWEEALSRIEECLALDGPDLRLAPLYALYRERILAYQAAPPAPGWDGVHVALTK